MPFGKDPSGDFFFVDTKLGASVFRFHYDEAMTCSVEASDLASYVAAVILCAGYGAGLHADAVRALVDRDRAKVKIAKSLSRLRA